MTTKELIARFGITLELKTEGGVTTPTGRIGADQYAYRRATAEEKAEISARKKEIYDYLIAERAAKEAAAEERSRKIAAIEGLNELRQAQFELSEWNKKFNASFEGEEAVGGLGVPPRPNHDIAAMKAKFPRAAAYLLAESWSVASHDVKATAGKSALEKIIRGEDYDAAISEMNRIWSDYCDSQIWN